MENETTMKRNNFVQHTLYEVIRHPDMATLYASIATSLKPWQQATLFHPEFLEDAVGKNRMNYPELAGVDFMSHDEMDAMSRADFNRRNNFV